MTQIARNLLLVILLCGVSSVSANEFGSANSRLEQAGLKVEWFTQLDMSVHGSVIDTQLVVDEDDSTTYFALKFGTKTELVSQKMLSPFGVPFGIEGAQAHAEMRKEIIQKHLDAEGKGLKVTMEKYTLPKTTLYTLTNSGLVTAIDADTGAIRWSTYVGLPSRPTIGLGANKKFVAVLNGSFRLLFDGRERQSCL